MSPWTVVIRLTVETAWILVADAEGNDRMQARLPRPRHRRALRTLLEGLALWGGWPLSVATSADELDSFSFEQDVFGLELDPSGSELVELRLVLPARHRDRLDLGDFGAVRRLVPGA